MKNWGNNILSVAVFIMKAIDFCVRWETPQNCDGIHNPVLYVLWPQLWGRDAVPLGEWQNPMWVSTAVGASQQQLPAARAPHSQLSIMD